MNLKKQAVWVLTGALAGALLAPAAFAESKKEINIFRAPVTPVIDGDLSDWPTAVLASPQPRGASRSSGVIYLSYDDENLYVAAEVKDDTPMRNAQKGGDIWNGDAIELHISFDPSLDPNRESYESGKDFQIGIAPNSANDAGPATWVWQLGGPIAGAVVKTKLLDLGEREPGYVIEAKIPLKSLSPNAKLVPGMRIGFAASIDFSDENGVREAQIQWFGVDAPHFATPKVWGIANIK